mgnify:CR=1 FL=1
MLDVKAEAQLVFAGTIESIEDTVEGAAVLSCIEITERLNTAVLLDDQFTGQVQSGLLLYPDTYWDVSTTQWNGTAFTFLSAAKIWIRTGAGAYSIVIWLCTPSASAEA